MQRTQRVPNQIVTNKYANNSTSRSRESSVSSRRSYRAGNPINPNLDSQRVSVQLAHTNKALGSRLDKIKPLPLTSVLNNPQSNKKANLERGNKSGRAGSSKRSNRSISSKRQDSSREPKPQGLTSSLIH